MSIISVPYKIIAACYFSILFLTSCDKSDNSVVNVTTIDVSAQWKIDANGNTIQGIYDGQWLLKTFTAQELALFNSLDTASLSGTLKPDSVKEEGTNYNFVYPTPFVSHYNRVFRFSSGYNGQVVYKYVLVDSLMNPLEKKAVRLQGASFPQSPSNPSSSNPIAIMHNVPVGRYRLYYTLSTSSHPHFYKSWGNIQKNP